MTIETDSDYSAYLNDFGVDITGDASFNGIFDHQYIDVDMITGEKPVIVAPYKDVKDLSYGDSLTIPVDQYDGTYINIDYTVIRIEHDGTGWALLILEEA